MAVLRYSKLYKMVVLCVISLMYVGVAGAEVTHEQEIERSFPGDDISLVTAKTMSGDVRISSRDQQEVSIKALKRVIADSDAKAQEYSDKVEIEIERSGDTVQVEAKQPVLSTLLGRAEFYVGYDISVPEVMNLDIRTMNGSVYVVGIKGAEKINIAQGNIELRNVVGSVSAKTGSGNIYAEMLFDAESSFFTAKGFIEIHIGDDFSVPISARAFSGSITITVPEGYPADIEASTQSGQITCDLPFDGAVEGRSLRGSIFGGGPLLKLDTVSGDISIKPRGEEAQAVPEADFQQEDEEEPIEEEEPAEEPDVFRAEAIKALNPPVIDGRLDDEGWKKAGRIGNFVWSNGIERAHEPTEARLLWDDENLYIGIKCYESRMGAMTISNTENDNRAWDWEEDMVQVFIDPTPDTQDEYYHITINPIGVVLDQKIDGQTAEGSSGEIRWDSDGLFDTDMRSGFWSIEMGIPFSSMDAGPQQGDLWRFNLYRMEKRREEHSYWSPTHYSDSWPHVPSRFGDVVFAVRPLVERKEPPVPSEEALTISGIVIEGNEKVSREEILDAMILDAGYPADVDALAQARSRLESLGWFQNVVMDLVERDRGVDLVVKVRERKIISPSEIQIRGARLFTEQQIMDYFNLTAARTTMRDVNVKCRLMERLYEAKGYDMVAVKSSTIADTLVININEGRIDRIEVTGNTKVSTKDIIRALDLDPGTPFKRSEIDNAVHTMKARLPYFREVYWEPERSDDGLNVVYIHVEEGPEFRSDTSSVGEFNRVHGLQLGVRTQVESAYTGSRIYAELRYGFSSKIWNYQFGVGQAWGRKLKTTVGIDFHRITDTNDLELISDTEHFIAEAILGEAWRDFYQRKGYELNFGQKFTGSTDLGLRYRDDMYTSLRKSTNWSILDRSYADNDWSDDFRWTGGRSPHIVERRRLPEDVKYKPENPPIEEGRIRSLIAEYTIDTRNSEKDPANGWFNTFSAEYAGRWMDGDSDFNLYKVNIRRYNRLSGNQFFAFRIKAATTDRELPELHPRKFYLGGIGTLRGYRFKTFSGDVMALINAEYWIMTGWPPGLGIVFFVDSGYAWPYDTEVKVEDMKTDIGMGFQLGGLRVNLASPLEEGHRETVLSVRHARMF